MADWSGLEKLVIGNRPIQCEKCGGPLEYRGSGEYQCIDCGFKTLDDYGRIRRYTDLYGPAPIEVIARVTGVNKKVINAYLRSGRMEIQQGSEAFLRCEDCGRRIRTGTKCDRCVAISERNRAKELASDFDINGKQTGSTDKSNSLNAQFGGRYRR